MMRKLAAVLIAAASFTAHSEDAPKYSHPPYQHPFEATLRAAEHGDVAAQVQLGRDYEKALGVEQDFERAVDWYREAANAGSPQAMLALGLLFQDPTLSQKFNEKPEPWLLRAAQTGLAAAEVAEGTFCASPCMPAARKDRSEWMERAAAQGDVQAMSMLGLALITSDDADKRKRGEEYVAAAEKAYPLARFIAESLKFSQIKGAFADKSVQVPDELRRAAFKIDVEESVDVVKSGYIWLGWAIAISGKDDFEDLARHNYDDLLRPLEASAREGALSSACNLAASYLGSMDYQNAFDWYQSAAKRGAPRAAYHLGKLYRDGLGTPQNASAAALWFYQSAMHGYFPAEAALGDLLLRGDGVPADYDAALGWLRPAAAYGNPMAQFDLGLMYYNGLGVQPDNSRAIGLIAVAAKETGGGDSLLQPRWPPALDWIERAQSNPAISSQIADALKRASWSKRSVDSAEGGCDEQSLNSKIEE